MANADHGDGERARGRQHGQEQGRYYKGVKCSCVSTAPRPATLRRSAPLPCESFGGGWRPNAAACSPPVKVAPTSQAVCAVRWPPAVISDGARRCLVAVRTSSGRDRCVRASAAARGRGQGVGFRDITNRAQIAPCSLPVIRWPPPCGGLLCRLGACGPATFAGVSSGRWPPLRANPSVPYNRRGRPRAGRPARRVLHRSASRCPEECRKPTPL